MPDYVYPTSAELREIEREKATRLAAARPIFELFPFEDDDNHIIYWTQKDMYGGLMAVRGLDGAPSRVKRVGERRYMAEPGVYGEFETLDEQELTMRRNAAAPDQPVDVEDLTMEAQDQLMGRRLDRQEKICWDLALSGVFSVYRNGILMHTDRYTTQTFTAVVAWSNAATSTPLADLRALQLLSRGLGVDFGAGASIWLNRTKFNQMLANTNAADLGGRKADFGASIGSLTGINQLLSNEGLPQIKVYDEGYFANDDGTGFTLWIGDSKGLLVGARPAGQRIGAFRLTRNVNNDAMEPGVYQKVIDRKDNVPRTIEVHDGFNGGPVLYYPGSLVALNI